MKIRNFTTQIKNLSLNFKNVLIVSKFSRFEHERALNSKLTDLEFDLKLAKKESLYKEIKKRYQIHHFYLQDIVESLKKHNCNVQCISVNKYEQRHLDDVDVVISAGGDGTFLSTVAKIRDKNLPVIGINTDVECSVGHLCIESYNRLESRQSLPCEVVSRIFSGNLEWIRRQRIQTIVIRKKKDVLSDLALNDILVSENEPFKTCYYKLKVINCDLDEMVCEEKQKSSGILISTGTGSTGWIFNMNKLWEDQLLQIVNLLKTNLNFDLSPDISKITETYNRSQQFSPEDLKLQFSIRELISNGIFRSKMHKGFGKEIEIKVASDVQLVIDGFLHHKIYSGSSIIFKVLPENSVLTAIH